MGFFKKISKLGDKIVSGASPSDESVAPGTTAAASGGRTELSNRDLLNVMVRQFKHDLERESVGDSMLYPMSFKILMHPNDYNDRRDALQFIIPVIVAEFYKVIRSYSTQYRSFASTSTQWDFHFMPFEGAVPTSDEDDAFTVEPGQPVVLARLYPKNDSATGGSNVTVERNVKVSIVCINSEVGKFDNINFAAIGRIDTLDEGHYTCPFDDNLPESSDQIRSRARNTGNNTQSTPPPRPVQTAAQQPPQGPAPFTPPQPQQPASQPKQYPVQQSQTEGYATLSYQHNGHNYTYTMLDTFICISGSNDPRGNRQIFKLNSPNIVNDHVQVRYMSGRFEIAAFGKTRLNQREMKLSSGSTVYWEALANNSSIFINEEIKVTFKRK